MLQPKYALCLFFKTLGKGQIELTRDISTTKQPYFSIVAAGHPFAIGSWPKDSLKRSK
jgi:hypothetical protein